MDYEQDDRFPVFNLPPTQGIKAYAVDGEIALEQNAPHYNDLPNIVLIPVEHVDMVIGWLQELQAQLKG